MSRIPAHIYSVTVEWNSLTYCHHVEIDGVEVYAYRGVGHRRGHTAAAAHLQKKYGGKFMYRRINKSGCYEMKKQPQGNPRANRHA